MVSASTAIRNPSGLYLRPAGILCKEALLYKPRVSFRTRTVTANAKGVLSVFGACVKSGDEITSVREGPDEKETLAATVKIVRDGLGEQGTA